MRDAEIATPTKGPDPDDFVIGDDASDISRVATPLPMKEGKDVPVLEMKVEEKEGGDVKGETLDTPAEVGEKGKAKEGDDASTEPELPEDVRKRLAKLESLTSKYQGMLSQIAFREASEIQYAYGLYSSQISSATTALHMPA